MASPSSSSSHVFEQKIAGFCEMRLSPILEPEASIRLKDFMVALVQVRARPPMKSGKIDWQEVADICGLKAELSSMVKQTALPGFDAIIRWLASIPENAGVRSRQVRSAAQRTSGDRQRAKSTRAKPEALRQGAKPGPKPRPIVEFPQPLFEHWEEPVISSGVFTRR